MDTGHHADDADGTADALTPLHPNYVKLLRARPRSLALPFAIGALVLEIGGHAAARRVHRPVLLLAPGDRARAAAALRRARLSSWAPTGCGWCAGCCSAATPWCRSAGCSTSTSTQGPLERAYGLATLVVHTAGTHNASVSLPGLGTPTRWRCARRSARTSGATRCEPSRPPTPPPRRCGGPAR